MATIKGGQKYAKAIADIVARLGNPATLRVGFLEGATYPDGTPVGAVAAFNEFGTKNAPPRPFFRNMVAKRQKEWPKQLAGLVKDKDSETALKLMGEGIRGQLQQSIAEFSGVPLAPSTIKRKGFEKQLIDQGVMINSVDYEVVKT